MPYPAKLTKALAETMSQHARQGLPIGRAASLSGIHRVTAQRWLREGAAEIDQAGDDDADLSLRATFAIDFEAARAQYLLGLTVQWQAAVKRKDANSAKVIATMLASVSPDEFSERRATRTIDQRTTLAGEVAINRYASMSVEDLAAERERIEQRRNATEGEADWRQAAVRLPGVREKRTSELEPDSGSLNRKSAIGGLPKDDDGPSHNNPPSRAQGSLPPGIDGTIDEDVFLP